MKECSNDNCSLFLSFLHLASLKEFQNTETDTFLQTWCCMADRGDGLELDSGNSRDEPWRISVHLRRNRSVTFTDDEVHDIGPLKSLQNEKGLYRSRSLSSLMDAVVGNMNALRYKLKKKNEEEKVSSRLTKERLKQSRAFMCHNLDNARAFNDDKSAWETREESLRRGQMFSRFKTSLSMPDISHANTSLQDKKDEV